MSAPTHPSPEQDELDDIITEHAREVLRIEADPAGKNVDWVRAGNKAQAAIRTWALKVAMEAAKQCRYRYKHNHDIQTEDGEHYICLQCRKSAGEIMGNDGMGECPHFRSFNAGIVELRTKLTEAFKQEEKQ